MKRQAIEKSLWRAAGQLPRPSFEKISAAEVEPMARPDYITLQDGKKAARPLRRLAVAAACLVLLLAGALTGGWFVGYRMADAVVSIDMNPSYEIVVNRAQQVLEVKALNAEAVATLEGREYKGWNVEEAVYTLFTGISEQGLITSQRPAILVSVEGKSAQRATELQQKVTHTIDMFMLGTDATANIVTQSLTAEEELRQAAAGYGISAGKMQLVRRLQEKGAMFSEEELAGMRLETLIDLAIAYALQDLDTGSYVPPESRPEAPSSSSAPAASSSSSSSPAPSSSAAAQPAPVSTPAPAPTPTPAPADTNNDSGHTPASPPTPNDSGHTANQGDSGNS